MASAWLKVRPWFQLYNPYPGDPPDLPHLLNKHKLISNGHMINNIIYGWQGISVDDDGTYDNPVLLGGIPAGSWLAMKHCTRLHTSSGLGAPLLVSWLLPMPEKDRTIRYLGSISTVAKRDLLMLNMFQTPDHHMAPALPCDFLLAGECHKGLSYSTNAWTCRQQTTTTINCWILTSANSAINSSLDACSNVRYPNKLSCSLSKCH